MGKYFNNVCTLADLKQEYKRLARVHHPDMGGELKIMQEVNAEFDRLFKVYQNRPSATAETAEAFRNEFYTVNGWKGSKYREVATLSTVEIAKLIRKELKSEFPECKFSVTSHSASMCSEISVALMTAV